MHSLPQGVGRIRPHIAAIAIFTGMGFVFILTGGSILQSFGAVLLVFALSTPFVYDVWHSQTQIAPSQDEHDITTEIPTELDLTHLEESPWPSSTWDLPSDPSGPSGDTSSSSGKTPYIELDLTRLEQAPHEIPHPTLFHGTHAPPPEAIT